eukprot:ANDGO_07812.mRNA.1 hypothetical protein
MTVSAKAVSVLSEDVDVIVDVSARKLHCVARLTCAPSGASLPNSLSLHARLLAIKSVKVNDTYSKDYVYTGESTGLSPDRIIDLTKVIHKYSACWDPSLEIPLKGVSGQFVIEVQYELKHFIGGVFWHQFEEESLVYTDDAPLAVRNWLPCVDELGCHSKFSLSISVPEDWTACASGTLAQILPAAGNCRKWVFTPTPREVHASRFGFCVGTLPSHISKTITGTSDRDSEKVFVNMFGTSPITDVAAKLDFAATAASSFFSFVPLFLGTTSTRVLGGNSLSIVFTDSIPGSFLSFAGLLLVHPRFLPAHLESLDRVKAAHQVMFSGMARCILRTHFSASHFHSLWLEEFVSYMISDALLIHLYGFNWFAWMISDEEQKFYGYTHPHDFLLARWQTFLFDGPIVESDFFPSTRSLSVMAFSAASRSSPLYSQKFTHPSELLTPRRSLLCRLVAYYFRRTLFSRTSSDAVYQRTLQVFFHGAVKAVNAAHTTIPWDRLLHTDRFFQTVVKVGKMESSSFDEDLMSRFTTRFVRNIPVFPVVRAAYVFDAKARKLRVAMNVSSNEQLIADGPLSIVLRERTVIASHATEIRGERCTAEMDVKSKTPTHDISMPDHPLLKDQIALWNASTSHPRFPVYYVRLDPLHELGYRCIVRQSLRSHLLELVDADADILTLKDGIDGVVRLLLTAEGKGDGHFVTELETRDVIKTHEFGLLQVLQRIVAMKDQYPAVLRCHAIRGLAQLAPVYPKALESLLGLFSSAVSAQSDNMAIEDKWSSDMILVQCAFSLSKVGGKEPFARLWELVQRVWNKGDIAEDVRANLMVALFLCHVEEQAFVRVKLGLCQKILEGASSPGKSRVHAVFVQCVLQHLPFLLSYSNDRSFLPEFLERVVCPFALVGHDADTRISACSCLLSLTTDELTTVQFILDGIDVVYSTPYIRVLFMLILANYDSFTIPFLETVRLKSEFSYFSQQVFQRFISSPVAEVDSRFFFASARFYSHLFGFHLPPSVSGVAVPNWVEKVAAFPKDLVVVQPLSQPERAVSVPFKRERDPNFVEEKEKKIAKRPSISTYARTPAADGASSVVPFTPAVPSTPGAARVGTYVPNPYSLRFVLKIGRHWGTMFLDPKNPLSKIVESSIPFGLDAIWFGKSLLRVPFHMHPRLPDCYTTLGNSNMVTHLTQGQVAFWPAKEGFAEILIHVSDSSQSRYQLLEECYLIGTMAMGFDYTIPETPEISGCLPVPWPGIYSNGSLNKFAKTVAREATSSGLLLVSICRFSEVRLFVRGLEFGIEVVPSVKGTIAYENICVNTLVSPGVLYPWTNHDCHLAYFPLLLNTPHVEKAKNQELVRTILTPGEVALWIPAAPPDAPLVPRSVSLCVGYGRSVFDDHLCRLKAHEDCELFGRCYSLRGLGSAVEELKTTHDLDLCMVAAPPNLSFLRISVPDSDLVVDVEVYTNFQTGRDFIDFVRKNSQLSLSLSRFQETLVFCPLQNATDDDFEEVFEEFPRSYLREGDIALCCSRETLIWNLYIGYNALHHRIDIDESEVCRVFGKMLLWSTEKKDKLKMAPNGTRIVIDVMDVMRGWPDATPSV